MHRLVLLLVLCASTTLYSAELTLVDGTVVEGELLVDNDREVRLRLTQGDMNAERSWPRSQVAHITHSDSPRQAALATLRQEAAALPADAPAAAWTSLALRAKGLDPTLARQWAARAVARDRHQAEAQRLLSRELVQGVWLRPHEAAVARGLVWHDGRWLTYAERERLRQEDRERQERQRAALQAAAERAERRRSATTETAVWYGPGLRPGWTPRVIWWGGPPRPCLGGVWSQGSSWGLSLWASGSFGSTAWKLRINW